MMTTNDTPDFCRLAEKRLYAYMDLKAKVENDLSFSQSEADKRDIEEIKRIEDAVNSVSGDYYGDAFRMRYFERKTDEHVAELCNCDTTTIRRNRKRLLKRVAVRLFGTEAIS